MDWGGLPEESRVKPVLKDEKDFAWKAGKIIHSSVQFCFKFYFFCLFVNYLFHLTEQKFPQGRIFVVFIALIQ